MMGLMDLRKKKRSRINERIPISKVRYCVLDTELTGLDERRDSIVSIAALKMTGGTIDLENIFNRLVHPAAELSAESVVIHGITPSEVEKKPGIESVLDEFLRFCGNDVIVGHCVSIDLSFINKEMKKTFGFPLENPALDTSAIYEWIRKRYSTKNFPCAFRDSGLYDVAKYFGIPVNGAHNAVMDAFITAQVFQRFIPMLIEGGIKTIGELLVLGNPSKGGDRFGPTSETFSL